ncbi:MAG: RNA polymerase sigma factor [Bacteroidetes bacterium]|nr:RNA polymerase sigma factor [Bacteroidota bacterium]
MYTDINLDLINECKKGSRSAQFRIYKLYYKTMYNTCLRIVNDTAEAEDIMQESFLDAFQKLDSYSGEGSFGSWLKRIVVNNSLDLLRKSKEIISLEEEKIDLPEEPPEIDEEEIIFRVKEIKKGIMQLPEEYRAVISLFLLEGYDHEEISEILHITNNTSRTRYSRAKQKLITILKENKRVNIEY